MNIDLHEKICTVKSYEIKQVTVYYIYIYKSFVKYIQKEKTTTGIEEMQISMLKRNLQFHSQMKPGAFCSLIFLFVYINETKPQSNAICTISFISMWLLF